MQDNNNIRGFLEIKHKYPINPEIQKTNIPKNPENIKIKMCKKTIKK